MHAATQVTKPGRKPDMAKRAKIYFLADKGLGQREIAEKTGFSRQTVWNALRERRKAGTEPEVLDVASSTSIGTPRDSAPLTHEQVGKILTILTRVCERHPEFIRELGILEKLSKRTDLLIEIL